MKNRVFFPQAALDEWIAEDRIDLRNDELTIKSENRKYRIAEAVRIMAEVTGQPDANELVGKVKSHAFLSELGAEILEGSVIIGDNAYDAVPGFVGAPVGSFADHRKMTPQSAAVTRAITNDEDLLANLLKRRL
jgi:hypothetical protein